jgi:cytochrome c5
MKATITLVIIAVIVFACHRRTIASSDDIVISNKTNTESKKAIGSSEAISAGQIVYSNRCGRCHYLKTARDYTPQQWENILKSMIPKAKLNDDEAKQVTAYVMANAKK